MADSDSDSDVAHTQRKSSRQSSGGKLQRFSSVVHIGLLMLALAAFALALTALLSHRSTEVTLAETTLGSDPLQLTSNSCDEFLLLQVHADDPHVILPEPFNVTACSFTFMYAGQLADITSPDVAVSTPSGQIMGVSLNSSSSEGVDGATDWTQLHHSSVRLAASVGLTQIQLVSNGENYFVKGAALGVTPLT